VRLLAADVDIDLLRNGAIAAIVVLGLLVLLVLRFVRKVVFKLIFIGVLVGGGVFIYSQRNDFDECQRRLRNVFDPEERCACEFAGIDVTIPQCEALLDPDSDG
jgi:hypothetical protein